MTVYDMDGNYVADTLRAAAIVYNVSHTLIAKYSNRRGDDHYLFDIPRSDKVRGPTKKQHRTFEEIMQDLTER